MGLVGEREREAIGVGEVLAFRSVFVVGFWTPDRGRRCMQVAEIRCPSPKAESWLSLKPERTVDGQLSSSPVA